MTADELRTKVLNIVRSQFDLPDDKIINDSDKLMDDLGGDDLDILELVMALEDGMTIEITDEEIYAMGDGNATIGGVITVLSKHLGIAA